MLFYQKITVNPIYNLDIPDFVLMVNIVNITQQSYSLEPYYNAQLGLVYPLTT